MALKIFGINIKKQVFAIKISLIFSTIKLAQERGFLSSLFYFELKQPKATKLSFMLNVFDTICI